MRHKSTLSLKLHFNGIYLFLIYLVSPEILPLTFGDEISNAGDVVAVQCMVLKGDLPLEIRWLHNYNPVLSENGLSIIKASSRISTLNIESVKGNHRGNYTCFAKNLAGSTEYSVELNVNGKN